MRSSIAYLEILKLSVKAILFIMSNIIIKNLVFTMIKIVNTKVVPTTIAGTCNRTLAPEIIVNYLLRVIINSDYISYDNLCIS